MLGTETQHPRTAGAPPRRADYGAVRLGQRDIDGLILCAEHFGAPYDLLAAALAAQPARLRGITARWRRARLPRPAVAPGLPGGRTYDLVPTRANGQPAFGAYLRAPAGGVLVVTLTGDRI